jgi:ribose/xylose/arabinose/galactoside ABC-type transport system permease subunit
MQQTRLSSFVEQLVNVSIGFSIALTAQLLVYPRMGIDLSVGTHVEITLMFTLISIIRGYLIRRYFNARIHRMAEKIRFPWEHNI